MRLRYALPVCALLLTVSAAVLYCDASRDTNRVTAGKESSAHLAPRTPPGSRTSPLEPAPASTTPGPAAGQSLFNRRCTGCHSLTQDREGPRLAGVYGRPAASVPGFPYSAALSTAAQTVHLTWNDQTLDRWLTDPDAFVPGVNMDFRVPRPDERASIIAFLKSSAH